MGKHDKQQTGGELRAIHLARPGAPSSPGHCHHLENWDEINCRWGADFSVSLFCRVFTKHNAAHVSTNKIESLNDFAHRFIPYVWENGVSFCQPISGCPHMMCVCVYARTYQQVILYSIYCRHFGPSTKAAVVVCVGSVYGILPTLIWYVVCQDSYKPDVQLSSTDVSIEAYWAVPVAFSIYRGHLCFPPSMWLITSKSDASTRWGIEMPEPLMREAALANVSEWRKFEKWHNGQWRRLWPQWLTVVT